MDSTISHEREELRNAERGLAGMMDKVGDLTDSASALLTKRL